MHILQALLPQVALFSAVAASFTILDYDTKKAVPFLVVAGAAGLLVLYLLRDRERRPRILLSCFAAVMALGVVLISSEWVLPAPRLESRFEHQLKVQLRRRNTQNTRQHRGFELKESYNQCGWSDVSHVESDGKRRRILLVADSFLECKSTRNLTTRIQEKFPEYEVIGLAIFDSGLDDYRWRIRELVPRYDPELVVLFCYAGNDFRKTFRFKPYESPTFRVSREAVRFLRDEKLTGLADTLEKRLGSHYRSREQFEQDLGVADPFDQELLYLTALAFSSERRFLDSTRRRVAVLCGLSQPIPPWRPLWTTQPYIEAFQRPKNERLTLVTDLVARDAGVNWKEVDAILKSQPQSFRDALVEDFDPTELLLEALQIPLGRKRYPEPWSEKKLKKRADRFGRYFQEVASFVRSKNYKFLVVMVPEASLYDDGFWKFWLGIADYRKILLNEHRLYKEVVKRASQETEVVDLAQYKDEFYLSHWRFDGHWGPVGNEAACEAISPFIEEQMSQALPEDQ